jgi:predicted RNase H-like HicB family nuclease
MKKYDVIIEQQNGIFRALIPMLPNIVAEGATRDEAIINAKTAAQNYLANVEVATVELAERSIEDIDQERERAELIEALEQMEPETELAAQLISLRLQMLREGQRLRSLDEINRDLGRGGYADVP